MRISIYFTIGEVQYSTTAESRNIDNTCTAAHLDNARYTAARLDLIRHMIGVPFRVNSWYRCPELNRAVNGSEASQHMLGLAVDFYTAEDNEKVFEAITELQSKGRISYDQCYFDRKRNFIHVSFCRNIFSERKMSWIK